MDVPCELEMTTTSVAIIGAGAAGTCKCSRSPGMPPSHILSGAAAAAAFDAEDAFDVIQVFERRETPGGTWFYTTE